MTEPDTAPAQHAPGRLLKLQDVVKETSLSSSEIYRRMAAGRFPRPHPIGGQRVAWLGREIEEWKLRTLHEAPSGEAFRG